MPTEVQITNRNAMITKRVTASLQDSDTGAPVLDVVIGPGEAVIVPLLTSMTLVVTLCPSRPEDEEETAELSRDAAE